jgi:hypothetical protein
VKTVPEGYFSGFFSAGAGAGVVAFFSSAGAPALGAAGAGAAAPGFVSAFFVGAAPPQPLINRPATAMLANVFRIMLLSLLASRDIP